MALNMQKMTPGQKLNMSKSASDGGVTLKEIGIGLSWGENKNIANQVKFDLDLSMIPTAGDKEAVTELENVIYYGKLKTAYAEHSGDERTGAKDGDDEVIFIDLTKVPQSDEKLIIYATIHEAALHNLNFGLIPHAKVRIWDKISGQSIAEMDLEFDADNFTVLRFGSIIRKGDDWFYSSEKSGRMGDLTQIFNEHNIPTN